MEDELECAWCGEKFRRPHSKGPRPKFCSASHRQRAYEAREREGLQRAVSSTQRLAAELSKISIPAVSSTQRLAAELSKISIPAVSSTQRLAEQLADMPLLTQTEALALRIVDQAATGVLDEDVAEVLESAERGVAVEKDPAAVLLVAALVVLMWRRKEILAVAVATGTEFVETAGMFLAALQLLVNRYPTIGGVLILLSIVGPPPSRNTHGVEDPQDE
jgi:hypothetical protein